MMSSTFGARFGGTTVGGHQGFESPASCLITPPNFGGGGGSCFPSMVVVALGEPGVPVICWADPGRAASDKTNATAITATRERACGAALILTSVGLCGLPRDWAKASPS